MKWGPPNKKTTYKVLKKEKKIAPTIIFSNTAIKWVEALVNGHDTEVGFYAVVDEKEDYTFFIRDVFYPEHDEANGATCEISADGEAQIMNYLLDKEREDDITRIRFWGHSHHTMGTGPSGQDETQALQRMNDSKAFLIRGICNVRGEMSISFFDYENQIRFDNVVWKIEETDNNKLSVEKLETIKNMLETDFKEDPSKTIKEVNDILDKDIEMEEIVNKVKKLKKKNIPVAKSYTYNAMGRSGATNVIPGDLFGGRYHRHKSRDNVTNKFMHNKTKSTNTKDDEPIDTDNLHVMMNEIDEELMQFEEQCLGGALDDPYGRYDHYGHMG